MNSTRISKNQKQAIVKVIAAELRRLEAEGKKATPEYMTLFGLEDILGALRGEHFDIAGKD